MTMNEGITFLAEAIKSTPEFSKLKQTRTILQKNPGLKRELDEFNKKQKDLYSAKLSTAEAESRVKELNSKFDSLSRIEEVGKYLYALKEFNSIMEKVMKNLNDSLEKSLQ